MIQFSPGHVPFHVQPGVTPENTQLFDHGGLVADYQTDGLD